MKRPMFADEVVRELSSSNVPIHRQICKCVVGARKVVIDNVADFLFSESRNDRTLSAADMPTVAPPFQDMWMEFRRPLAISDGPSQYAFLMLSDKRDDGWNSMIFRFMKDREGIVVCPVTLTYTISPDGTIGDACVVRPLPGYYVDADLYNRFMIADTSLGLVALFAVSLMHCKNTTMATLPDSPSQWIKKARKRGHPTLRYNIIDIQPMCRVIRNARSQAGGSIARALHICRGHFKDYRESGLFGKIKGVFWWAQHARGDAKNGVVVSDYNVKI